AGVWEVRGGPQEFLFSRVMCWVAFDRALKLAFKRSFPAPVERWRRTRDEIYHYVFHELWNPRLRAFVQYRGAENLDASCLLMPLLGFISDSEPRWLSTLAAVERELVEDSLVYRYRPGEAAPDGFEGEEGSFTICS